MVELFVPSMVVIHSYYCIVKKKWNVSSAIFDGDISLKKKNDQRSLVRDGYLLRRCLRVNVEINCLLAHCGKTIKLQSGNLWKVDAEYYFGSEVVNYGVI